MCFSCLVSPLDCMLFIDPNALKAGSIFKGYFSPVDLHAWMLFLTKELPMAEPF